MAEGFRAVLPPRRKPEEGEIWHLSFADMMTILLCFFVLLTALSSFNAQRYQDMAEAIARTMGGKASQPRLDLDRLEKDLAGLLNTPALARNIEILRDGRGVAADIRGGVLFPSGQADLIDQARPILAEMARLLKKTPYQIKIEGHTDDAPIATGQFPSNWELSGARAAAVARFLIERGVPAQRIFIAGYADTRPKAPNDSPEHMAQNRRVRLLIGEF